jgi:hypothetical protein
MRHWLNKKYTYGLARMSMTIKGGGEPGGAGARGFAKAPTIKLKTATVGSDEPSGKPSVVLGKGQEWIVVASSDARSDDKPQRTKKTEMAHPLSYE